MRKQSVEVSLVSMGGSLSLVAHIKELIKKIEISPEEDVAMMEIARSGTQSVHLVFMPVGKKVRAHYHRERDEFYVILQGKAKLRIKNDIIEVGEGHVAFIPRGTIHGVESVGADPLVLVFVSSPPYDPRKDRRYVE